MTETTAPTQPRPLVRDPDHGMFAGVCTAVARYTDTDPVLWRIVTVVLTVFGGAGAVLYGLGWLLIPKVGADASIAEQWMHRRHRLSPMTIIVVAGVTVLVFAGLDNGHGLAAVAVLAVIGYLVYRDRQGRPVLPPYVPPTTPPPTTETVWTTPEPGPTALPAWPTPVDRGPRSRLGAVTLSVAALVSGLLVLARTYGAHGLTPARILAVALLVVGAGLVVGTWIGRARWLFLIGLLLALALASTAATDDPTDALHGGIGGRTWVVTPADAHPSFRLGIGEATVDLRALPTTGPHVVVRAHVGAGHLIVLVPDGVPIRMHAKVELGEITEFGSSIGNGSGGIERTRSYGPTGDPRVELEADVTAGQVEVRHG